MAFSSEQSSVHGSDRIEVFQTPLSSVFNILKYKTSYHPNRLHSKIGNLA